MCKSCITYLLTYLLTYDKYSLILLCYAWAYEARGCALDGGVSSPCLM